MGAYLSHPITTKETHGAQDAHFQYGVSAMQGWRTSMEDAHVATLSLGDVPDNAFFGVYDGHGGAQVARFCSLKMPGELLKNEAFMSGDVGPALKQTYLAIDTLLRKTENIGILDKLKADSGEEPGIGQLPISLQKLLQNQMHRERNSDEDEEEDDQFVIHNEANFGEEDDDNKETYHVQGLGYITIQKAAGNGDSGSALSAGDHAVDSSDAPASDSRVVSSVQPDTGTGEVTVTDPALEGSEGALTVSGTYQGPSAGCTAVVAVVIGKKLFVANAGDSRCVLCRGTETISLTEDHKPTDPLEQQRILSAGGFVTEGRVNGCLNLSRAIGDMNYKQSADKPAEEQIVTADPDIREIELTAEDKFILLACDGIWDILTNEEAVEFIGKAMKEGHSPNTICEMLCDRCLATSTEGIGKGCDNMSAMIVVLKTPGAV